MDDAGYVPPGGPPTGGPQPWELDEVFRQGWETLKRQPLLAVALFIMYLVPNLGGGVSSILEQTGLLREAPMVSIGIALGTSLFAMVASTFLQIGLLRMFVTAARGQEASFGLLFSGADRFLPMIGYSILTGFAVVFGLILFVVPGIIVAIGLSLGQYYLIDQRQGVIESMKSSWEATNGNKGNLFLFFLIGGLITMLGLCACIIGVFATSSVVMLALAIIYLRRSGQASALPGQEPQGPGMQPPAGPGGPPGGY
jgi:uncharacterized membrane protein